MGQQRKGRGSSKRGDKRTPKAKAPGSEQPDLPVEAVYLEVNLVGQQRNEAGDIHGTGSMWSGNIFPAEFGQILTQLRDALEKHGAPLPNSLLAQPDQKAQVEPGDGAQN